jgi:hypothetical protein
MYWRIWDLWGPMNLVALLVAETKANPPYLLGVHRDSELGSGGYLARFKLARIFITPSDMSDSCLLQSFSSNSTFIMLYRYHEMDVDYLVANEMVNINVD